MNKNSASCNENDLMYKINVELPDPHIRLSIWNRLSSFFDACVILLVVLVGIYIFYLVPKFLTFSNTCSNCSNLNYIWIFVIISAVIAWIVFLIGKLLLSKLNMYADEFKAVSALRRKLIEESKLREILIQELQIKRKNNI